MVSSPDSSLPAWSLASASPRLNTTTTQGGSSTYVSTMTGINLVSMHVHRNSSSPGWYLLCMKRYSKGGTDGCVNQRSARTERPLLRGKMHGLHHTVICSGICAFRHLSSPPSIKHKVDTGEHTRAKALDVSSNYALSTIDNVRLVSQPGLNVLCTYGVVCGLFLVLPI